MTNKKACNQKTRRGNSYRSATIAHSIAYNIRRRKGDCVEAYHCPVCGLWHVGGGAYLSPVEKINKLLEMAKEVKRV